MKDLRKYARHTQNKLVIGFLILVFTVGLGLIYVFYGLQAAISGLLCLGGILIIILLVVLILTIIERSVKDG